MKKTIINDDIYFTLAWSPLYKYDKFNAIRVLPELSGIICLLHDRPSSPEYLVFYSCWRDGCRLGMRKLLDPYYSKIASMLSEIDMDRLYYKYTIVEGSIQDSVDVMYWLLKTYKPKFNDAANFKDSQRFKNIYLNEIDRDKNDVVEKIPGHMFK